MIIDDTEFIIVAMYWSVLRGVMQVPGSSSLKCRVGRYVCPRNSSRISWVVVPGKSGTYYKYKSSNLHQFLVTQLLLLICRYMWISTLGHIPRHTGRTSLYNIIITRYWHLTRDILGLYLWDIWHNTLSCSSLTYDVVLLCWITWLSYFQVFIPFSCSVIVKATRVV